jgi:hypothetical protein
MEELETWKTELMKEIELSNYSLSEPVIKYSTSKRYQENILLRLTFEFALDLQKKLRMKDIRYLHINFLRVLLLLVQILRKPRMQRVKPILFIN